jgi:hypothetical protein
MLDESETLNGEEIGRVIAVFGTLFPHPISQFKKQLLTFCAY